ncbi:MAG: hypothetical protein NVSMB18_31770 [Acetobacteraceae bacterium]
MIPAVLAALPAWALPPSGPPDFSPFAECDAAIAAAERPGGLPDKLLPAIARVESGRLDAATGRVRPWPWTINVEGTGHFYDSKVQVVQAVQELLARGVRSIDVGCMQVNLMHHPRAFAGLDEAFDPAANARYAAKFLTGLYHQAKDWNLATGWYHSQSPDKGEAYQRLVFGRVMVPMVGAAKPAGPYGVWPPVGEKVGAIPPAKFAFGAFVAPKPMTAAYGLNFAPVQSIAAPAPRAAASSPPPTTAPTSMQGSALRH